MACGWRLPPRAQWSQCQRARARRAASHGRAAFRPPGRGGGERLAQARDSSSRRWGELGQYQRRRGAGVCRLGRHGAILLHWLHEQDL